MNLNQPPIQVLQAFINLRANHDFETIREWLRDCRKTARNELENHADEGKFARIQGRSQTLAALIELSLRAPELLDQRQTRIAKNESRKRTTQGR